MLTRALGPIMAGRQDQELHGSQHQMFSSLQCPQFTGHWVLVSVVMNLVIFAIPVLKLTNSILYWVARLCMAKGLKVLLLAKPADYAGGDSLSMYLDNVVLEAGHF